MGAMYTAVNEKNMTGYELGKGSWVLLEGVDSCNYLDTLKKILYNEKDINVLYQLSCELSILGDEIKIYSDSDWCMGYEPKIFLMGSIWGGISYDKKAYKKHILFYGWKAEIQKCLDANLPIPDNAIKIFNDLSEGVR